MGRNINDNFGSIHSIVSWITLFLASSSHNHSLSRLKLSKQAFQVSLSTDIMISKSHTSLSFSTDASTDKKIILKSPSV